MQMNTWARTRVSVCHGTINLLIRNLGASVTADVSVKFEPGPPGDLDAGQAVVDEKSQVVLAASLRQSPADCSALPGMLTELAESLTAAGIDGNPAPLLADAGYFSAGNVQALTDAGIDPLLATVRLKHGEQPQPVPRERIPEGLTPNS